MDSSRKYNIKLIGQINQISKLPKNLIKNQQILENQSKNLNLAHNLTVMTIELEFPLNQKKINHSSLEFLQKIIRKIKYPCSREKKKSFLPTLLNVNSLLFCLRNLIKNKSDKILSRLGKGKISYQLGKVESFQK